MAVNNQGILNKEIDRIRTYSNYPAWAKMSPLRLARAGFYYCGDGTNDDVRCFSCNLTIGQWQDSDDPMDKHRTLSPDCTVFDPGGLPASSPLRDVPISHTENNVTLREAFEKFKSISMNVNRTAQKSVNSRDDGLDSLLASPGPPTRPSVVQADSGSVLPQVGQDQTSVLTKHTAQHHTATTTTLGGENQAIYQLINNLAPTTGPSGPLIPRSTGSGSTGSGSTDPRRSPSLTYWDALRSEKERKRTYYDWPEGAFPHTYALAAAGFFFTGVADKVRCAFCKGVLRNWEQNDVPRNEHFKFFPDCPFMREVDVGNIPLDQSERRDNHYLIQPQMSPGPGLGIMTERPKHPHMALEGQRLDTYTHPAWQSHVTQTPADLAKAGFFFAGFGDNVKCFFCDGGLRNWEPQDEPWFEHAHWFPRCPYVRMSKGEEFIQAVQRSVTSQNALLSEPSNGGFPSPAVVYRIEPKEIVARMDTPVVQMALSMGFSADTIRKTLQLRLQTTGDDFPNASSFLEAVLTQQESPPSHQHPAPPHHTSTSSCGLQSANTHTALSVSTGQAPSQPKKPLAPDPQSLPVLLKADAPQKPASSKAQECYNPEVEKLLQENEEMKEQRVCKVCMDSDVNIVFLPCAHLVCCSNCTPALRTCPICRKLIKGVVRIYLS